MSKLELALIVIAAVAASTKFLTAAVTLFHYRRRNAPSDEELRRAFPGGIPLVTIFKPCKGADPGLYENLASFMRLEGAPYEVLLGIADRRDPAVEIAQRIIRDFPGRDVRLYFTGDKSGHNPKVMNLVHLEPHARGELWMVADSNVHAKPDLLRRLVLPMADRRVGLSYAMFRGVAGNGVGARMQAAIFDTLGLPSICVAFRLFGIANLVGKSFILRRSVLEELGGFTQYERYLVEDALIGRDVQRRGYKVALANDVVDVHLGEMTPKFVWSQEMRWAVLQRLHVPTLPLGTLVWNPWFSAALAAVATASGMHTAAMALWAAAVHNQLIGLVPYVRFGGWVRDLWALVLAEALLFGVMIAVYFHRDVVWRGQRFTLGKDTVILAAAKIDVAEPVFARPAVPLPERTAPGELGAAEIAMSGAGRALRNRPRASA